MDPETLEAARAAGHHIEALGREAFTHLVHLQAVQGMVNIFGVLAVCVLVALCATVAFFIVRRLEEEKSLAVVEGATVAFFTARRREEEKSLAVVTATVTALLALVLFAVPAGIICESVVQMYAPEGSAIESALKKITP